jgi:hypothetical protein
VKATGCWSPPATSRAPMSAAAGVASTIIATTTPHVNVNDLRMFAPVASTVLS